MIRKLVTSFLWFFAVAWAWNYIAALAGLPAIIGLGLGASVALFVWADPRHLIWERTMESTSQPATATLSVSAGLPNQG